MIRDSVEKLDSWLEQQRVRLHILRAEWDLKSRYVGGLTHTQHANRAQALDALARYRQRGLFPRNISLPGRTPIFVDTEGRQCAVAHLLTVTGHSDFVDSIRSTANLARVPDMRFPALASWATEQGMTVAELARIQPEYGSVNLMFTIGWSALLGVFALAANVVGAARAALRVKFIIALVALATGLLIVVSAVSPPIVDCHDAAYQCNLDSASGPGHPSTGCIAPLYPTKLLEICIYPRVYLPAWWTAATIKNVGTVGGIALALFGAARLALLLRDKRRAQAPMVPPATG